MKGAHAHLSLFKNDFGLSLAATTATKKDSDDEVMQLNRDQSIYICSNWLVPHTLLTRLPPMSM